MADTLEKRIEALEKRVQEIAENIGGTSLSGPAGAAVPRTSDIQRIFGEFADDPTYEEAERLGEAWRRRQRKC